MASSPTEDLPDNTCVVCFKCVEIFSIGLCDHPVCYECSTRMRVLCRQNECPICRQDMPKVIFTKFVRPYNALKDINTLIDKKFKIVFETVDEKRAYEDLLAHECSKCSKVFSSFTQLRDHVRRVHQLNYCELCVENLKILTRERRCYSRQELTRHREAGDIDDKSHRGHPLCKFCDTRYMDNDELYRHLRRDHLYCHFCDADGLDQYYSNYDFLRDHFRLEHFLCEEGDCLNEKFTAVFRSEIDLKAHKANIHGKGLGKAGLKQARTLELEFTLTPRPRPVHSRQYRHRREDEIGQTGGGGGESSSSCSGQTAPVPPSAEEQQRLIMTGAPPSLDEDFPALGPGAEASLSLRLTSKQPSLSIQVSHPRFTTTVTSQNNYNLHFPALDNGQEAGTGAPSTTSASTMTSWSSAPKRPIDTSNGRKKAVQTQSGGSRKEEFPSLVVKESHKSAVRKLTASAGSAASKAHHQPTPPLEQPQTQPSKTKKKKSKSGKGSAGGSEASEARERLTTVAKPKKKTEPKHTTENNRGVVADNNNGGLRAGGENNNQMDPSLQSFIADPESSHNNKNKLQVQVSGGGGEDFPSLSASAPPGFTSLPPAPPRWAVKKPAKPPPGFQPPPTPRPPPGFSELNGEFPPLSELSTLTSSSSVEVYTYVTPNNFAKRNSTLVKLINGSLVGETLEEFKQISDAFRRGSLAAPEYYAHCREMMGPANFRELFPELLALLPDIDKQLELWKVYKADKARWIENGTVSKKKQQKQILDSCLTCGQILKLSDLNDHLRRHGRGVFGQTAVQTQEGGGQAASNPWATKQQGPPPQAT